MAMNLEQGSAPLLDAVSGALAKHRCEICNPCYDINGSECPAVSWCEDCDEMLCNDCYQAHRKVKFTRNHQLVPIEDMKSYQDKPKISDRCEHHAEKLIKYYCQDHSVLGCSQCFITKHRQCSDVVCIADFAIDECQEIKTVEEKLSKLEDDTNRNEQEKIKNQDRVHQHHNRIIADVSDHADKLVNIVRRLEQEKLAELDKTKKTELDKLENVDTLNSSVKDGLSKLKLMFDASKDNNRLMFITMKHIQKEVPLLDSMLNQSMEQNMFAEQEFALSPELVKVLNTLTELGSMKNTQVKEIENSTGYVHTYDLEATCVDVRIRNPTSRSFHRAIMEISSSHDIDLFCVLLDARLCGRLVSCCIKKESKTLMVCSKTCLSEGNRGKFKLIEDNSVIRLIANQIYMLEVNTSTKTRFIHGGSFIPEITVNEVQIRFREMLIQSCLYIHGITFHKV